MRMRKKTVVKRERLTPSNSFAARKKEEPVSDLLRAVRLGSYTTTKWVAQGLHSARHDSSGREVLLQVLDPNMRVEMGIENRWQQEAKIIEHFINPNQAPKLAVRITALDTENNLLVLEVSDPRTYQQLTAEASNSTDAAPAKAVQETVRQFLEVERWIGETTLNYQLKELLGIGAMGWVFKAVHTTINNMERAVKIIDIESAMTSERANQEVQSMAKLGDHPNIVAVYDYTRLDDGHVAVVMEYVKGKSLDWHITDGTFRSSGDGMQMLLTITKQLLSALVHAHDKGIVHRDIKPSNIMLVDNGSVQIKLLDFGIAKILGPDAESYLTIPATRMGTPHYMSPQAYNGMLKDADAHKTDLYSVGATLFHLIAGRPVFENVEDLIKNKPPSLRDMGFDISTGFETFIHRLLEKEPENRYANAAEALRFLKALPDWKRERPITQSHRRIRPPVPPVPAPPKRRWGRGLFKATVALALTGGAVFGGYRGYQYLKTEGIQLPASASGVKGETQVTTAADVHLEVWTAPGSDQEAGNIVDTYKKVRTAFEAFVRDKHSELKVGTEKLRVIRLPFEQLDNETQLMVQQMASHGSALYEARKEVAGVDLSPAKLYLTAMEPGDWGYHMGSALVSVSGAPAYQWADLTNEFAEYVKAKAGKKTGNKQDKPKKSKRGRR